MIYEDIPGGVELLAWFGRQPTFHDGEILSLTLNRSGISELKIHGWITTDQVDANGYIVLDKHAVVTFGFEDIVDLVLDGFSHQNVVYGLTLNYAIDRGRPVSGHLPHEPTDIDIKLEPCYGLEGFIRVKKLTVSFEPGRPETAKSA